MKRFLKLNWPFLFASIVSLVCYLTGYTTQFQFIDIFVEKFLLVPSIISIIYQALKWKKVSFKLLKINSIGLISVLIITLFYFVQSKLILALFNEPIGYTFFSLVLLAIPGIFIQIGIWLFLLFRRFRIH